MKAEIIAVGTELLMGQIANTNAMYLSKELSNMGISVHYHHVVGDNADRLEELLLKVLDRSDIVITTGGLGPTMDDLTKETIASALGLAMIEDAQSMDNLCEFFRSIRADMTSNNQKQAYFPEGCEILLNPNGTAPGCMVKRDDKRIFVLPGPPREMQPMFNDFVAPKLLEMTGHVLESTHIKVFGVGESLLETKLMHLIKGQTNPTLATYATGGELLLRVTANGNTKSAARETLAPVVEEIKSILGKNIYSYTNQTLSQVVVESLSNLGKKIAFAESCTGGMLASMIVDVPGASNVLNAGYVTYSNESKIQTLGVSPETILTYTVYSSQIAEEMVHGAYERSDADIAVSLTGLAEAPDGKAKLCYISIYDGTDTKTIIVEGRLDRQYSRRIFCSHALYLVLQTLDAL